MLHWLFAPKTMSVTFLVTFLHRGFSIGANAWCDKTLTFQVGVPRQLLPAGFSFFYDSDCDSGVTGSRPSFLRMKSIPLGCTYVVCRTDSVPSECVIV